MAGPRAEFGLSHDHNSTRGELEILLNQQFDCVSASQLVDLELGRGAIKSFVRLGYLHRLHRGVFCRSSAPSPEQRCMAAVLAVGAGAALSCLSSAVMRGWWKRSRLGRIDVTSGRRVVRPELDIHFSRHWNAKDVVMYGGLPHTTGERLTIDLGGRITRYQLTNIVKEAAFWDCFDLTTFESERNRLNNPSGTTTAQRAVASFASGCAGTRSALEDRMIQLIDMAKLPLPDEAGMPIGPHEADLVWLARGLVVEVDGPGHRQPNSRRKDPARDRHLRSAGFEVVRFTNYQIDGDPFGVITQLERLLSHSA